MNYFDLYSSYPDHTIAAAWDSQVKEADTTPWLANTLTGCGEELFARFAARYAELRALPRAARRALQRRLARSGELAAILPQYLQQGGRRLQHRMAWSLAGAALLLALGQGVATAATITVTTNNPNIAADGECSLIEAIVNANNDAATFPDCAAGNGADTIVLPANANLMLSAAYSYSHDQYWGPVGLPPITSRITIEGNGATIARQGNAPAFGLIFVKGHSSVAGAPPTPGDLTLQYVTLSGGGTSQYGEFSNNGTASIKNSIISGNVLPFPFAGLGVSNGGTLTIENSVISSNGAGVSNGGTLTIERSTISGNTYPGVENIIGDLAIENSTISSNGRGGVYNYGGRLTITNSTISGNHGAGVSNLSWYYVGGNLTLNNSLIAGNQAAVGPEIENSGGIVNANNFNLFGTNGNAGIVGFTPGPTDIVPSVPLAQILGPLQNNGGPTQTHALVAGSPAIDAGDPSGCRDSTGAPLQTDQRGFARNIDGNHDGTVRCDIGAVEFGAGFVITPVDFDGDGVSDIGIYRNGAWLIVRSSDGSIADAGWGGPSWIPVPADYDGDGITDIAVYNTTNGVWSIIRSSDGGNTAVGWGGPSWIPVPADYDGDGITDIAVYNTTNGVWSIIRSSDGANMAMGWGDPSWKPVPADYDGDGKADIAVYNTTTGVWAIIRSSDGGNMAIGWGDPSWKPVPADYDGDGKADIAAYNTTTGVWAIIRSSDGAHMVMDLGGAPNDIPLN
jgi:hypothetical protein